MPTSTHPSLSAEALLALRERTRDQPADVVREAEALLPAARATGDRRTLASLLTALGAGLSETGNNDRAQLILDEALEHTDGDAESEAGVRAQRLSMFISLGESSTVDEDIERLTAILDGLKRPRETTAAMNALAGAAFRQGRLEDAGLWLERASRAALDSGDRRGATIAATNAVIVSIELERYAVALTQLRNALAHTDSSQVTVFVHAQHALLYSRLELHQQALDVIDSYLDGRPLNPPAESDKVMLINKAEALTSLNRLDEAADIIERHALHLEGGLRIAGEASDTLGRIYGLLGRTEEARALLTTGLELLERGGLTHAAARTLLNRAELELPHDPQFTLNCTRHTLERLETGAPGRLHARAFRLQAQAHAALGEYRLAYELGERHRHLQDDLDRRLERQRLDVALAELEYERAQVTARIQREALREARQEVAELHAHLEARVERRTQELHAANEELRAFAHSVSHYLRTPMQVILGHATLLDQVSGAQRTRSADAITGATERMAEVLDGLLAYAARGAVPQASGTVDLDAVVRAAWADQADPQRAVAVEIGPIPPVRGDAAALRVVFGNLLHNALKYTGEQAQPHVQVSASVVPDGVLVEVRDNGVGFDPADATRLFGAFTRLPTTTRFEGLGLGLADVWRIVIAHGGHVRAEGRPGEGASFFVTLPAAEEWRSEG
ncbi:signal transduction histidine kinase [Deinococcus metalli]|uniref:histidine kinase n=1 Tax=Deinococcus metalli TaxID=1141878 RepID=A0A7W8KB75_9DEIO|nr:ATP-binding protein [Deinococcus metalli]MBB5374730.1 signal transduction histidine kinase [Deinococcus metalli]GHF34131.1 hypothetical protein GCM10017781_08690 [Deinococcus metalli]